MAYININHYDFFNNLDEEFGLDQNYMDFRINFNTNSEIYIVLIY